VKEGASETAEDLDEFSILIIMLMFGVILSIIASLLYLIPKARKLVTTKV
jgi:hypothetical protein